MATENVNIDFRTTCLWLRHFTEPCCLVFLSVSFTFSHMSQSFCFLMDLKELQKIYIKPWYSLFNSPSARQMVENFPSKLFFFWKKKKRRHVYCAKYLLCNENFNYSSEKQILKNENILTATLNTSAKKKKIPIPSVFVFVPLLKYFDLEMLPHRGFCQSNSH